MAPVDDPAGKKPLTRAERTNFAETSHHADVIAFIDSLKLLGARIQIGSLGKTSPMILQTIAWLAKSATVTGDLSCLAMVSGEMLFCTERQA